jgi:hypothetical protein
MTMSRPDNDTLKRLADHLGRYGISKDYLLTALSEFNWGESDHHPMLPYARAVADKLRETWPWHTFGDEMLLEVLETGKPGDPPAREMAERLCGKLNVGFSLVAPITDALRTLGWDGVVPMPAGMFTVGHPNSVLPLSDGRRLRLEAFAMRAPMGLLVFEDPRHEGACRPAIDFAASARNAWAWAQSMVDQEPK